MGEWKVLESGDGKKDLHERKSCYFSLPFLPTPSHPSHLFSLSFGKIKPPFEKFSEIEFAFEDVRIT